MAVSFQEMSPSRPYLIRALHEWIVDNQLTPYLLVDCGVEGVRVPPEHVSEGRIILNVSPAATQELHMGNELIAFSARFAGKPQNIEVPVEGVLAIYARENGRGMVFSNDNDDGTTPDPSDDGGGKPHLRVVK
jgi:stringent starvation protein B